MSDKLNLKHVNPTPGQLAEAIRQLQRQISGLEASLANLDTSAPVQEESTNFAVPSTTVYINNNNWRGVDLSISNGGTGASTASGARGNLGLGSAAVEDDDRYLHVSNNLSDLASVSAALVNLALDNVDNTSDVDKPVSTAQQTALDLKIDYTDIIDTLTSMDANVPLSANQGRVLKGFIDTINDLLDSDDVNLDELQEVVDFIKANRDDLDNLAISNIAGLQSALDAKQATITGAASTITVSNLSINRALVSNGSGKVAVSAVTSTELGYLDGVTSSIQTQLNAKADSGAFGIGVQSVPDISLADGPGNRFSSGIYRNDDRTNEIFTSEQSVIFHGSYAGGRAVQLAANISGSTNLRLWGRTQKFSDMWEPAVEFFSTGNTSANVQTMLASADNGAIRSSIGLSTLAVTYTPSNGSWAHTVNLSIKKLGKLVIARLSFDADSLSGSINNFATLIAAGFRPEGTIHFTAQNAITNPDTRIVGIIDTDGDLSLRQTADTEATFHFANISWFTA